MSWRSYITRKLNDEFDGNRRALARAVGLTRPEDVSQWIRQGRTPRPETIDEIVTALGDTLEDVAAEITAMDDPVELAISSDPKLSDDEKGKLISQLQRLRKEGQAARLQKGQKRHLG